MMKLGFVNGFLLSTVCLSHNVLAHTCGPVLQAHMAHFAVGQETSADRLFTYLTQLQQMGVLKSNQIKKMIENLNHGQLINPFAQENQEGWSSADQIHSDRIDEYLRSPVDQRKLQRKLQDKWDQLQADRQGRQDVTEETQYIFAPVSIPLPQQLSDLDIVDWHLQIGSFPLYTAWARGQTIIVDLQTLFQRKLSDQPLSWNALLRLPDGSSLVAYDGIANHILIENVHTGEPVGDLDMLKLGKVNFGTHKLLLEASRDGTLFLYMRWYSQSATWMSYNVTNQMPVLLAPPVGPYLASKPTAGQNLVRYLLGKNRLKVLRLSEHEPNVVFDEDQSDELGTFVETGSHSNWDGKSLFYAYGEDQIKIFDPDKPEPQRFHVPTADLDQDPFVGFYESSTERLNAIVRLKKDTWANWNLGKLDASSQIKKCELPDSSNQLIDRNFGLVHHFPEFFSLKLNDRRNFLIGLSNETDPHQKERRSYKLYVVDLSRMTAEVIDVSAFDVGKLLGVQKLNDGRVIGYFSRENKLKVLQILGPHDGKTFAQLVRQP